MALKSPFYYLALGHRQGSKLVADALTARRSIKISSACALVGRLRLFASADLPWRAEEFIETHFQNLPSSPTGIFAIRKTGGRTTFDLLRVFTEIFS